ncbi:hypothetical protein [Urechidicola croceus]|uniref:Anti-sigma factor n=1 Tax=Urechidicola croceus TaxID=1850246 RepID=A0A1D8P6P9_9FLAO|nr:hypothetical protein [Urechidicola croceus]AOW20255.1 hypothetical protein LPB138_05995 [Urechidicola croceus]
MAQDIKKILEQESKMTSQKLPEGHFNRFEKRLETEFPKPNNQFSFLRIAASIVLLLSISFAGYKYFKINDSKVEVAQEEKKDNKKVKSLAEVSPELKKIEQYYLAKINYQISTIKITEENKDLLDVYLSQLSDLQREYKELNSKLNSDEVTEQTIDSLIENLQLRLQLLRQLKKKLELIENLKSQQHESIQA